MSRVGMELKKVLQVMPIEHKTHRLSSRALAHLDGLLDEALEQTFPASDAVAIDIERESHDTEARVLDSRRQPEGGPADCTETLTRVHEQSSGARAASPRASKGMTGQQSIGL